jgi:hypothetical protein
LNWSPPPLSPLPILNIATTTVSSASPLLSITVIFAIRYAVIRSLLLVLTWMGRAADFVAK